MLLSRRLFLGLFLCVVLTWGCSPTPVGPGTDGSSSGEAGTSVEKQKDEPVDEPATPEEPITEPEQEVTGSDASESLPEKEESIPEPVVEEKAPPQPTTIDTKMKKSIGRAGEIVGVECSVKDQYGDDFPNPEISIEVSSNPRGVITDTSIAIQEVGEYKVACQLKDQSLKDSTPADYKVIANLPNFVDTKLNPPTFRAGESTTVVCTATDAFGNPVLGLPFTLNVSPSTSVKVEKLKISGTVVGQYEVACRLSSSVLDRSPATLQIVPGKPDKIEVTPDPKKPYYDLEETILLNRKVTDKYGNEIKSAKIKVISTPATKVDTSGYPDSIGFGADGVYSVVVSVDEPTEGGKKVQASLKFSVDGTGPTIVVSYPARAAMIRSSSSITIRGTVTDKVSGVATLKINGRTVKPASNGSFSLSVRPSWGINLIEVETTDKAGKVGYRAQSYLYAGSFFGMGSSRMGKAAIARLNQRAIDDGNRSTLNDLASILEKVINSLDINSYVPSTLVSGSYKIPPFGPRVGYSVTKNGTVRMGYRSVKLRSRTGGLNIEATVRDIRVPLKGSAARFLNKSVTIVASSVRLTGSINLSYSRGQVNVSVASLNADVSNVRVNAFSGLFSFLNGLVTSALRSTIKKALENAIKGAIPGPIKSFLSGFKFGTSFTLPSQLGSKRLTLGSGLDSLRFDSNGGTLGLAVSISASRGISSGKLGTALRGFSPPSWSTSYAFGVGLAYNILNHAFTTAWYSGALKQDLSSLVSGSLKSVPIKFNSFKLAVDAKLPPILHTGTKGHNLDVAIGDLLLSLDFDIQDIGKFSVQAYLTTRFGAKATLSSKNELSLNLSTQPMVFALDVVKWVGPATLDTGAFSSFIRGLTPLISQILSSSILQKFPIPSIDLSSLGGKYGIPRGTKLTVKNGKLSFSGDYLKITGDL